MGDDFKLSAQLAGHDSDIRAVSFPQPDTIVSASRDYSVRLWRQTNKAPPTFDATETSRGSEFVNSLAFIPASAEYPNGLIVSAGKDTLIDIRQPAAKPDDNAERLLIGHTNNVCALAVSSDGQYVVSGSWDSTARVWSVGKWETEVVLGDHEAGVWAVLPINDTTVVTGCADKNIRVFDLRNSPGGEAQPISTIYTPDIVRALCKVPKGHPSGADIASAHNDGVIRLYKLDGQAVGELHGHESFIYSLDTLPTGEIVSAGEDRTVRIWSGTECVQTITHPAISVWSVAVCQATGDIASGASDAVIRIFTRSPDRVAGEETLAHFEESVKSSSIPQQQVGGINKEKLPGPEFLKDKSGTKDGQVQMIREDDGSVTAHTWSSGQQQWINVGTVVNAAASSGRKVEYNGQSYDYVFDVDIEEGKPPLKLPYNLSENPYDRATKWLGDNELPLSYLDQVANFIVQNTEGATLGQNSASGADPYGTESRYRPGGEASSSPSKKVIPQQAYLDISAAKYEAILNKILSINSNLVSAGRKDHSLNPSAQNILSSLRQALESNKPITDSSAIDLVVMMVTQWDYADRLAPLDLLRCIARSPVSAKYPLPEIATNAALQGIPSGAQVNENLVMMAFRTIANAFSSADGQTLVGTPAEAERSIAFTERVLGLSRGSSPIGKFNRNLHTALATMALNYAVLIHKSRSSLPSDFPTRLLKALSSQLSIQNDPEVLYRSMIAAGTIASALGSMGLDVSIKNQLTQSIETAKGNSTEQRVRDASAEVLSILKR